MQVFLFSAWAVGSLFLLAIVMFVKRSRIGSHADHESGLARAQVEAETDLGAYDLAAVATRRDEPRLE